MKVTSLCAALLALSFPPASLAAQEVGPPTAEERVEVRPELEARLDAGALDLELLYAEACGEHGEVEPLLVELASLAADAEQPAPRRLAARRARAGLLRRSGALAEALEAYEALAEEDEADVAARLEVALLRDALGREEPALEAYEALLERELDEATESRVRLRLALLQMGRGDEYADALAAFASAEGQPRELRNRAAIVLALLDRPGDAIELFEVDEADEQRYRQELRVAEWAVRAEDAERAQDYAWRAVRSARLRRDRSYAHTILVEAHRLDDSLDVLVDKLAAAEDLHADTRQVWIELLRERGRYDEAIALFKQGGEAEFSVEERRELLEMYREQGDEEVMIAAFRELVAAEPRQLEWREGLSRSLLERGDRAGAVALWEDFLGDPRCRALRLEGGRSLMALGLDELALRAAEDCIAEQDGTFAALIFLFDLHRNRGRLEDAQAALERMEQLAPPGAAERYQLADAWEQLGRQDRAVVVLESVRAVRGPDDAGEDLEMRLAWLYSEIGEEEVALERWRALWKRLKSVSRRRYAEDRMMTVASRLGNLADIAIDLEKKLVEGTANERESGLLVRLYTKVGDPVSAAEVIDEFMKQSGGSELDTLQEKGRVYLACNDYYNYEKVVRRLIELDPEGEPDYLQQLAMSQLERGKPDEARVVLARLKELDGTSESAEFEAGVLALAGMREEAVKAYRKGVATNPGRIESYLLMANLMKELGDVDRAVGLFQHLAETSEKDDLFTIAIDGLLNVEAPAPVMQWARRVTLERLARRHDKMYLYQLLSDLAEQVEQREGQLTALENSLAISGERRPSVLRELMDLAKAGRGFGSRWEGDEERHLAYGRRLIGLSEVVPPQVYLDLGEAFLRANDPQNAQKTFRLASDLPDYEVFQRQAAGLFEQAGFRDEALDLYKRVLVAQSSDVGLMVKVGELEEQNGRDDVARRLYGEALELLFSRQPLSRTKSEKEKQQGSFFAWFGSRNVDEYDKYYGRLLKNLLVVQSEGESLEALLQAQRAALGEDLATLAAGPADEEELERDDLDKHPRLRARAGFYRRLATAFGRPELADEVDLALLAAFPRDEDLLESLAQKRVAWGLHGSVRRLLDEAARPAEERDRLRFLVGQGLDERSARRLPIDQASGLFLPQLMQGADEAAAVLLLRTDFSSIEREDLGKLEPLFSAALYLDDPGLTLQIGREWVRLQVKHKMGAYSVEPVMRKCQLALDAEGYRNLCLSFTDLVLAKPEENSSFLTALPELQQDFDEPLVTEEQVMELLDDYADGGWGFGLGPVVLLLPEDRRGGAMRTVWSKVKPTQRAYFLINLVAEATGELGDSVCRFVEEAWPAAMDESENEIFNYYVEMLVETRFNQDLALAMLEAMVEREPENQPVRAGLARALEGRGEAERALELALEVYRALHDYDGGDWEKRRALDELLDTFLPERLEDFVGALDAIERDRGESVALFESRLKLLRQVEERDAALEVLEAAVERFPEEVKFLDQLRSARLREGRRAEALALLERVVELDEERKEDLLSFWEGQQNPVRALAVKEELRAEGVGSEESEDLAFDVPAGAILVSAGGVVLSGGGDNDQVAEDRPSIEKVKEATDAEDFDQARTWFRRLWRQFPKGEQASRGSVIYFTGQAASSILEWPGDEEEEDGEEEPPSRGGLADWADEEPEEREPGRSAYDALAEYDFGVDEMRRLLRSKSPAELDRQADVFRGLLRARVLARGAEAVLRELVEEVRAGGAGKLETYMLLTLLDEEPELQGAASGEVLADLARAVRPVDIGPLRSLARVQARLGHADEARRLYRWLATRTEGSGFYFFGEAPATISQRELLDDVKENLEGEDRLAVIDMVIRFADPGDYPWARNQFEKLVLETYMELLEPAEALERSRSVVEGATDFSEGMRREVARLAAVLYAQNGEVERALECLEYGLCSLDPNVVEGDARYWNNPTRPGYWNDLAVRQLFPKDGARFADYEAWLVQATATLRGWLAEERVHERQAVRGLVIACLRLADLGALEEARDHLRWLASKEELGRGSRLLVIDALRRSGDEALADSMEREDLVAGVLHLERLHEVVRRELERAGPEAALVLGAPITEFVLNERLLELLVEAAEAARDEAALERWTALRDTAAAARARLEEIAEEEAREEEPGS